MIKNNKKNNINLTKPSLVGDIYNKTVTYLTDQLESLTYSIIELKDIQLIDIIYYILYLIALFFCCLGLYNFYLEYLYYIFKKNEHTKSKQN